MDFWKLQGHGRSLKGWDVAHLPPCFRPMHAQPLKRESERTLCRTLLDPLAPPGALGVQEFLLDPTLPHFQEPMDGTFPAQRGREKL